MAADPSIPPEEQKGFFAAFVQNHVAATLVALAFVVAGLAALFSGKWVRDFVEGRLLADMARFAVIAEREYAQHRVEGM